MAWLYTKYPSIYWNTANLLIDSSSIADDFGDDLEVATGSKFYEFGQVEDDEDKEEEEEKTIEKRTKTKNFGAMATAIAEYQKNGVVIAPPDINESAPLFKPDERKNIIYYGLKGINKMNDNLLEEIMIKRPFADLNDFLTRVKVNRAQGYSLAKSGALCFGKEVEDIMVKMVLHFCEMKNTVNLRNAGMLIAANLIPDTFQKEKTIYEFNRYINQKKFKVGDVRLLDERAQGFLQKNFPQFANQYTIEKPVWEKEVYNGVKDTLRDYIKENKDELLIALNKDIYDTEWNKYCLGGRARWEFDSLSCYIGEHETIINGVDYTEYMAIPLEELPPHKVYVNRSLQYHRIIGTVLDHNKNKKLVTILTESGVIRVKMHKGRYAKHSKQVVEMVGDKRKILEKSYFTRGNILIITGYRTSKNYYYCDKPKNSMLSYSIGKLTLTEDGYAFSCRGEEF